MTIQDIALKSIEGFHVGGERVYMDGFPEQLMTKVPGAAPIRVSMNGHHMVGQMYCQRYTQSNPRSPYPLVFLHGGDLTGACWENTPDGRPGWLTFFLKARYDACLCDAFERGRASWPAYPEILAGKPEHRTLDAVWHHFRFGPASSYCSEDRGEQAYPGQQFPVEHLDVFGQQFVPRWAGTDHRALAGYRALLEKIGPCVLIGHSQGAYYALQLAQEFAGTVKGVVAIEPSAVPELSKSALTLPPHLAIWGDFIRDKSVMWESYLHRCEAYFEQLQNKSVDSRVLELPTVGVSGNSHMLMMDANSNQVAGMIDEWLVSLA